MDDVIAEALVRVFPLRNRIANFSAYLARTAHRLALDVLRTARIESVEPEHRVDPTMPGPDQEDQQRAARTKAMRELASTDPIDATILHAFVGSTDDRDWARGIAAEPKLTENAVRVRKHRAIQRLRRLADTGARSERDARHEKEAQH